LTFVVTLYRVTNPGDNIGNVGGTEKIDFNSSKNQKIENPFLFGIDGVTITNQEGLGDNSAPGQDLGNQQSLGPTEKMYVLRGYITKMNGTNDDGQNAFVAILEKWDSEAKQPDDFEEGRFGLQIGYLRDYDVIPVGTGADRVGLIWLSMELKPNLSVKIPRLEFEIRMRKSRGDGS